MSRDIDALNARFFALCRLHGIRPNLNEHGEVAEWDERSDEGATDLETREEAA